MNCKTMVVAPLHCWSPTGLNTRFETTSQIGWDRLQWVSSVPKNQTNICDKANYPVWRHVCSNLMNLQKGWLSKTRISKWSLPCLESSVSGPLPTAMREVSIRAIRRHPSRQRKGIHHQRGICKGAKELPTQRVKSDGKTTSFPAVFPLRSSWLHMLFHTFWES